MATKNDFRKIVEQISSGKKETVNEGYGYSHRSAKVAERIVRERFIGLSDKMFKQLLDLQGVTEQFTNRASAWRKLYASYMLECWTFEDMWEIVFGDSDGNLFIPVPNPNSVGVPVGARRGDGE